MGIKGKVRRILATINTAHILMDAAEAQRLSRDKRVKRVQQDVRFSFASVQSNPGWGLDRLDSPRPALDYAYHYNHDGAGRTVYVLDSGLALTNANVAAEFGARATNIFDFTLNGGAWCDAGNAAYCGQDTLNHGTQVASIVGGNRFGVAKGVTIKMVKVGNSQNPLDPSNPPYDNWLSNATVTLDFLAANPAYAPRGTIANLSLSLHDADNDRPNEVCNILDQSVRLQWAWEGAVAAAYHAGIIVVVNAGNDGCDTANYSPTRMQEAFVVGATAEHPTYSGRDERAKWLNHPFYGRSESRMGANISTFAPGDNVASMDKNGNFDIGRGTSLATPRIAGLFAIACQVYAPYCETQPTSAIYDGLRSFGSNTVTDIGGVPFANPTHSTRFIHKPDWW